MKDKGYIFTVSTFFLLSSVLLLALFFSSRTEEMDIAGPKLSALYDDIRGDIFTMLDVSISVANLSNFTTVIIEEDIPATGISDRLSRYESYIEQEYTSEVSQFLEEREGSLAGADVSMSLAKSSLLLEPYGYFYEYDNLGKEEIFIYPQDNNTNLLGLMVNLTLDGKMESLETNLQPGDWPVRVIVQTNNLSYDVTTNISRELSSTWDFNLSNGKVNLTAGQNLIRRDLRNGTFEIKLSGGVDAHNHVFLIFRKTYRFLLESGYTITLRDIIGHRLARKEGTPYTEIIDFARIRDNIWFNAEETRIEELPLYVPEPEAEEEPVEPVLLGFCYCAAPCYYWEEYWEGDIPCALRQCPIDDPENPACDGDYMLTFLLSSIGL